MIRPAINISLPEWCDPLLNQTKPLNTVEERMRLALRVASENIQNGGGPFGAAVFDQSGQLISIGMNLVTPTNCSVLHAEIVALIQAEQALHSYDLSSDGKRRLQLVTTCEPCSMCLGATIWSGVSSIAWGARDEDARSIGFDEGPKPADPIKELSQRGIEVISNVLRDEAVTLLNRYHASGQPIYNAGKQCTH